MSDYKKREFKNEYGRLIDVATGQQIPPTPGGYWGEDIDDATRCDICTAIAYLWLQGAANHTKPESDEPGVQ